MAKNDDDPLRKALEQTLGWKPLAPSPTPSQAPKIPPVTQVGNLLKEVGPAKPTKTIYFQDPFAKPTVFSKFIEGFGEGSTANILDIPAPKSKTIPQKISYVAGDILGFINPLNPVNKLAEVVKGVPLLGKALGAGEKVAKPLLSSTKLPVRTLGKAVAGVSRGIPFNIAYSTLKAGVSKDKGKEFKRELKSNALFDVAVSQLPVVGIAGLAVKEEVGKAGRGVIKNIDDFISAVTHEYKLKPLDQYETEVPKIDIKEVLEKLKKKFDISPEVINTLKKEKGAIEGSYGVLQNQNGKLAINLFKEPPQLNIKQLVEKIKVKPKKEANINQEIQPAVEPVSRESLKLLPERSQVPKKQPKEAPLNVLPANKEPLFVGEEGVVEKSTIAEANYLAQKESESVKQRLQKIVEEANKINKTAENFRQATLKEDPSIFDKIYNSLHLNQVVNRLKEKIPYTLRRFRFEDPNLDNVAKQELVYLVQGLNGKIGKDLEAARQEAKQILGRELTAAEVGSLIRQDTEQLLQFKKQGATDVVIGEELADEGLRKQLEDVFRPIGDSIAAVVLAYQNKLDEMLNKGEITPEVYDRIKLTDTKSWLKNLGKYLRTYYDKQGRVAPNLYQPALLEMGLYTPSRLKKLSLTEWAKAYLQVLERDGIPFVEGVPSELVDKVKTGEKGALEALGHSVKESMGYIIDGDKALRKTAKYITSNFYNLILAETIASRKDLVSDTPVKGWVRVTEKALGPLFNKYIDPKLLDDVMDTYKFVKQSDDWLGQLVSSWKFGVTVARPAAWVRNMTYGVYIQQTLAGNSPVNPANWRFYKKGLKEYVQFLSNPAKASKELKLFTELGGGSGGFISEEVLKMFEEVAKNNPENADAFMNQLVKAAKQKGANIAELYSHIDAMNKYILFLQRLHKGYTPEEAVIYAHKYLNNYALNPKFFRDLAKNPAVGALLPFISFTVANTPLLVETLVRYPHRLGVILSVPLLWKQLFLITHPDISAQVEAQKPNYQRHNLWYIPIAYDSQTGKITYWDLGKFFNIPLYSDVKEQSLETLQALGGSFVQPGGMIQPLSSIITGRDIFGRDLELPYSGGRLSAFVQMLPFGIAVSNLNDVILALEHKPYSMSGKVRTVPEAIARLFGINLTFTLPDQVQKNISAIKLDYSSKIGIYRKVLANPNASPAVKREAARKIQELYRQQTQDIAEVLRPYWDNFKEDLKQRGVDDITKIKQLEEPTGLTITPISKNIPLSRIGGSRKVKKGSLKTVKLDWLKGVKAPSAKKKSRYQPVTLNPLPKKPNLNYLVR